MAIYETTTYFGHYYRVDTSPGRCIDTGEIVKPIPCYYYRRPIRSYDNYESIPNIGNLQIFESLALSGDYGNPAIFSVVNDHATIQWPSLRSFMKIHNDLSAYEFSWNGTVHESGKPADMDDLLEKAIEFLHKVVTVLNK